MNSRWPCIGEKQVLNELELHERCVLPSPAILNAHMHISSSRQIIFLTRNSQLYYNRMVWNNGAVLNTVVESGVNKIVIIEIRSLKIHTKFQYVWQQQSKAACCNFTEQGDGQAK